MKWPQFQINRRQWLEALLALATPFGFSRGEAKEAQEEHTLQNPNLDFCWVTSQGKVTTRCLKNKLANERVDLPETEFAFEFDGERWRTLRSLPPG